MGSKSSKTSNISPILSLEEFKQQLHEYYVKTNNEEFETIKNDITSENTNVIIYDKVHQTLDFTKHNLVVFKHSWLPNDRTGRECNMSDLLYKLDDRFAKIDFVFYHVSNRWDAWDVFKLKTSQIKEYLHKYYDETLFYRKYSLPYFVMGFKHNKLFYVFVPQLIL